jgi:hypothetical protein
MDTRRSYYLASRQDDVDLLAPDEVRANFTAIPYVTPANDNAPTKDRLSTRVGALLCRLIALHGLIKPF